MPVTFFSAVAGVPTRHLKFVILTALEYIY